LPSQRLKRRGHIRPGVILARWKEEWGVGEGEDKVRGGGDTRRSEEAVVMVVAASFTPPPCATSAYPLIGGEREAEREKGGEVKERWVERPGTIPMT
jgi:hypothetical protein